MATPKTQTKVCKDCVSFPQDTTRGAAWPPRILVYDVVVLSPQPYKSFRAVLRDLQRRVRLLFFGPPRTALRCLVDTANDLSCMPATVLNAVGARKVERDLGVGATRRVATPQGPRRVHTDRYLPLWEIDVGLAQTPLFRLAVERDEDPKSQDGILSRDALANFPLLLEPSSAGPMTHIPAKVL